jgi:hypothetical protein
LPQDLVVHLRDWTRRPPLESLATIVETHAPSLTGEIFDNYDLFLALLSDDRKRTRLENLKPDQAYKDDLFLEIRHVAAKFDAALIKLLLVLTTRSLDSLRSMEFSDDDYRIFNRRFSPR